MHFTRLTKVTLLANERHELIVFTASACILALVMSNEQRTIHYTRMTHLQRECNTSAQDKVYTYNQEAYNWLFKAIAKHTSNFVKDDSLGKTREISTKVQRLCSNPE